MAYIVLMLVLGLSDPQNEQSYSTSRGSRWKSTASPVRFMSARVGRAAAPRRWTFISNISEAALSPFSETHVLCSDLLCMHTVYVTFLP